MMMILSVAAVTATTQMNKTVTNINTPRMAHLYSALLNFQQFYTSSIHFLAKNAYLLSHNVSFFRLLNKHTHKSSQVIRTIDFKRQKKNLPVNVWTRVWMWKRISSHVTSYPPFIITTNSSSKTNYTLQMGIGKSIEENTQKKTTCKRYNTEIKRRWNNVHIIEHIIVLVNAHIFFSLSKYK